MLIEFTVGNFLSFKEKKTFSMQATAISEFRENVIELPKHRLLKGAVIYGANASGKSNLVKAMRFVEKTIQASAKMASTDEIETTPFLLNTETRTQPSYFEIVILRENIQYRYGFEVTRETVVKEWLFENKKHIFLREGENIELAPAHASYQEEISKTNPNTLFLAILDSRKQSTANTIFDWYRNYHEATLGIDRHYRRWSISSVQPLITNIEYEELYKLLNLGFNSIRIENEEFEISTGDGPSDPPKRGTRSRVLTSHEVFDNQGNYMERIEFDMDKQESTGTRKVFDLLGPIVTVLEVGGTFVMDEMDANLHPLLTKTLIHLFKNPQFNLNNAQLILTTHNSDLLEYGQYRRDQIWFTEKDKFGATDLYSLVEFQLPDGKKVRKDSSKQLNYLEGRYGAIPYLGNIDELLQQWQNQPN